MTRYALTGAEIFDGETRHRGHALLVANGRVEALCPEGALPEGIERRALRGGLLAPGFVDIQVNGGGGVLVNETPSVEGIAAIAAAHAKYGTTAMLPTVITDRPDVTFAAIEAAAQAKAEGVPGAIGIHVEGPFIDPVRKGAHDPALIRRMEADDLERLTATTLRPFLITVAPESVSNAQITALAKAGILVSLGHSDTDYDTAVAAFRAGASCVTHLFNAMSQMGHRTPGLVGAALGDAQIWCGFIPDGHHVHPAALGAALRAKAGGTGRLIAVTDAMPTVGSPGDTFVLGGRTATRANGRLTLDDGTLAGSDLSAIGALRYMVRDLGLALTDALRMLSLTPSEFLGIDRDHGRLRPGFRADMVWLEGADRTDLGAVWIGGEPLSL